MGTNAVRMVRGAQKEKGEKEAKAKEAAEKEARAAAKAKKAADEAEKKQKETFNTTKNDTAEAPAASEEADVCDAFGDLDLNEKYGHDWSMTEIQDDKITKKNVVEYMDANASDDFKAANGLPVSKSALKKTTKDEFVKIYAKMLKECPK